jgi:hypothetical protein
MGKELEQVSVENARMGKRMNHFKGQSKRRIRKSVASTHYYSLIRLQKHSGIADNSRHKVNEDDNLHLRPLLLIR